MTRRVEAVVLDVTPVDRAISAASVRHAQNRMAPTGWRPQDLAESTSQHCPDQQKCNPQASDLRGFGQAGGLPGWARPGRPLTCGNAPRKPLTCGFAPRGVDPRGPRRRPSGHRQPPPLPAFTGRGPNDFFDRQHDDPLKVNRPTTNSKPAERLSEP